MENKQVIELGRVRLVQSPEGLRLVLVKNPAISVLISPAVLDRWAVKVLREQAIA